MDDKHVGQRILQRRNELGMKQTALARAAKTAQQTISAYEEGSRRPKISILIRIAGALGCRPIDLDPTLQLDIPPELARLLQLWPRLLERDQNTLVGVIESILRQYEGRL